MSAFVFITFIVLALYVFTMLALALAWRCKVSFRAGGKKPSTSVSLVIAARNEAENIGLCLQRISAQDYPPGLAELILVDDHSEDSTLFEAQKGLVNCPFKYSLLQLSGTAEKGKKAALTMGIKAATGQLIITTDADCMATDQSWISTVTSFYESKRSVLIISPVATAHEGGFLSAFQAIELMGLGVCTAGSALLGNAVMCNGANLAVERSAFFGVKGYEGNENIASGDDVFLLNKIQKKYPGKVDYLESGKALVFSPATKTLKAFIQQRLRWAGKFGANRNSFNFYLGALVLAVNLLFVIFAALSCFFPQLAKYLALLALAKWLIDFLLVFLAALSLKQTGVLWWYLPAMLVNPLYVCFTAVFSCLLKPVWKGRKI